MYTSRSTLIKRLFISSTNWTTKQLVNKMSDDSSRNNRIQYESFRQRLEQIKARTAVKTEYRPPNYASALVPTLHSDSFDMQGRKIHPWVILKVFDHLDISWPQYRQATNPGEPDSGTYILKLQMDVAPELYDIASPMHPLLLESKLLFLKRSSRSFRSTMRHPEVSKLYAIMTVLDVNVNLETRRPVPLPDFWRDPSIPTECNVLDFEIPIKPGRTITRQRQVYQSDIDENGHMNYTSYIRFCHDSFVDNLSEYSQNASQQLEAGVKQIQVTFKSECLRGDILNIASWEDSQEEGTYHFEITKEVEIVVALTLRFFGKNDLETKSKI